MRPLLLSAKIAGDDGDDTSSYQVPSGLTGNARPSGQTT